MSSVVNGEWWRPGGPQLLRWQSRLQLRCRSSQPQQPAEAWRLVALLLQAAGLEQQVLGGSLHTSTQRPGSCLNSVQRAMGLHAQVSSPLHRVKCRQKGGHVLTRMSSGEACTAAFQTQRPRVTTEGGLNVKAPDGQQSLRQLRPRPTAFLTKVSLHCEGAGLFASEITCL